MRFFTRLSERNVPPDVAVVAGAAMVFVVAIGDLVTGPYLVFSTFYLIPVVVAAWFGGRGRGVAIAFAAALTGVVTAAIDPGSMSVTAIVWNGSFRFLTYVFMAVLVDAAKASQTRIAELSLTDPLTGLANRREFYRRGEAALASARRMSTAVAVAYVDVDDLKLRNDTIGHRGGDAMLCEVATIAASSFRRTDLLARVGGDEFCFLMADADLAQATEVLDRFVAALGEVQPDPIRVSVGLIAGVVDDRADLATVIHDADGLMYQAKQAGKGRRVVRASLTGP